MIRQQLGNTGLEVHPLCLGGNVWGWTADRKATFEVLDAYTESGGNFLDTADSYSKWVDGHIGGESESLIGEWISSRGTRDSVIVTTKVFGHPLHPGLSARNIREACDASLRRLQTDYIDIYMAHHEDPDVPIEETVAAMSALVDEGKVRVIGASNFRPDTLTRALDISAQHGLAAFQVIQDHYNLMQRDYESQNQPVAKAHGLAQTPYYALASGYLTGKHRPGRVADSARTGGQGGPPSRIDAYIAMGGLRVLDELDRIAGSYGCDVATVALAWLLDQPTVSSVVASARRVDQLPALMAAESLRLTLEDVAALDKVLSA